jgi:hypothetical protein
MLASISHRVEQTKWYSYWSFWSPRSKNDARILGHRFLPFQTLFANHLTKVTVYLGARGTAATTIVANQEGHSARGLVTTWMLWYVASSSDPATVLKDTWLAQTQLSVTGSLTEV